MRCWRKCLPHPFWGVVFSLFFSLLYAGELRLTNLQTSLLSKKDKEPITVTLSLALEGRDVTSDNLKLVDSVQIALGGFWAETLATAEGKEALKKQIVAIAAKKYGLEVGFVYLLSFKIETDSLERCIKLMRSTPSIGSLGK